MNRRSFLRFSSLFAAGIPFADAFGATPGSTPWQKPKPPFPPDETWPREPWESVYRPDEFVYLKPSVQLVDSHSVAIFWKSQEIAYGWAEVSQDGGKTWTRVWSEQDGVRDINTRTHLAVFEAYDPTKPLKYRAVTRPVVEYACWGQVRFAGEELPEGALSGYYINTKAYKALVKERAAGYRGVEYVDEGEIGVTQGETYDIVMFTDVHHGITNYPKLLDKLGLERASLAVFAGDICDHSRSEADFDKHLDAPMAYVSKRLGCLTRFVRGNHEMMGQYARLVRNHVALQDNALYGAVTVGDMRLLFLDTATNAPEDKDAWTQNFLGTGHYFAREGAWLRRELASSEWKGAKRRLAFSHIPPRYGKWRAQGPMGEQLMAPLATAGVSLFCAGHEHDGSFAPSVPEQPYPLVIGGGPYAKRGKTNSIFSVTHVSVAKDAITVRQVGLDGAEAFNEKISAMGE